MPKCCKCEAETAAVISGYFNILGITETSIDLGVKSFYFNKDGANTLLYCYCEKHFREEVLLQDFVKNAIADVEARGQAVHNKNEELTKQNADLKTELDARKNELEDLKTQSKATTLELEKYKSEIVKATGEQDKLKEEVNRLKQEIKQLKDAQTAKDKEMSDLKAQDPEKAKLHASVKIGLDFSKYHMIPSFLLKWRTRLTKFDHEKTLQDIHDRIKQAFFNTTNEEVENLHQLVSRLAQSEEDTVQKKWNAHNNHLEEANKRIAEDADLDYSESEKLSSMSVFKSKFYAIEYCLQELRRYNQELQQQHEPNDPNHPDEGNN